MTRLDSRLGIGIQTLIVLWLAATVSAHHSHGNYGDNFIDLQGTVKEVHLLNPHSWVYLDVRGPNGQPQTWALEATNRIGLERVGVTADTLKPGVAITVRCHPLRDGSRGCLLGFVKTKDGTVTDWDGTRLPMPPDF
jgi:hypothetical protein